MTPDYSHAFWFRNGGSFWARMSSGEHLTQARHVRAGIRFAKWLRGDDPKPGYRLRFVGHGSHVYRASADMGWQDVSNEPDDYVWAPPGPLRRKERPGAEIGRRYWEQDETIPGL